VQAVEFSNANAYWKRIHDKTSLYIYIHTHTHTHTYTYIYIYIYEIYRHTHTHTHTHTKYTHFDKDTSKNMCTLGDETLAIV